MLHLLLHGLIDGEEFCAGPDVVLLPVLPGVPGGGGLLATLLGTGR